MKVSKNNTVLTVVVIVFAGFTLAGLGVVPALELANADSDVQLLKNSKPKNPNHKGGCTSCVDFTIDEPVIKLLKGGNNKNHDKPNGHN
jgi:hypothetical protein